MSEDDARRRFLEQMETLLGQPLPDDPVDREELGRALADQLGEPVVWTELERRWEELRPHFAHVAPDPDDVGLEVEAVFQTIVERLGAGAFEPEALGGQPPGIRMLIATRAIEAQIDNGGWPAVFYNNEDHLLPLAVEGYRLLGLDGHSALAERAKAHGFDLERDDDAFWVALDEAWSAFPSGEQARAVYLRAHPGQFDG